VVPANENLASTLMDLEAGERGYFLTGNRADLEPYQRVKAELSERSAARRFAGWRYRMFVCLPFTWCRFSRT
jgi:CHASE3 domain sensor protein